MGKRGTKDESVKEFEAVLEAMKIYFPELEFSAQNNKINSYINALMDKLRNVGWSEN